MGIEAKIVTDITPPADKNEKLFICLGGSSESGKSSFSQRMLQTHNVNRVKYLKATNEFGINSGLVDTDPFSMLGDENEDRRRINEIGAWRTIDSVTEGKSRITVIESLKHPGFLKSFARAALNGCLYVVYIDADLNLRINREASHRGLSIEETTDQIRRKDMEKTAYGSEDVRKLADMVLYNNGNQDEYLGWIDEFAIRAAAMYPSDDNAVAIEYL